jgi:hypothetical protein
MKTISYESRDFQSLWNRLANEYTALSIGRELGFTIRRESKMLNCDDAPVGVEQIIIHLDFDDEKDYTLFALKYR